ncbi:MAG: TraR/DksA C4-type zinc finger protein [Betaproteobacteria bacterium]
MRVAATPAAKLTADERAALIARLHQHRAELAARVDAQLHGSDEDRRDEAGMERHSEETDDDAAAEAARHADIHALNRMAHEVEEVEAALRRVAQGSYGECIDCGDPVGAARLAAYPAALRCAGCQSYVEQHRGRTAHG